MCNLSGIFHQVCYAGAGTVIGGVVAGPLGAAVGGVVGKCCHYNLSCMGELLGILIQYYFNHCYHHHCHYFRVYWKADVKETRNQLVKERSRFK